jgi:hypothetical protein
MLDMRDMVLNDSVYMVKILFDALTHNKLECLTQECILMIVRRFALQIGSQFNLQNIRIGCKYFPVTNTLVCSAEDCTIKLFTVIISSTVPYHHKLQCCSVSVTCTLMEGSNHKQSARWQHTSHLKASAFCIW